MIMKRIKFRRAIMMIRGISGDALCIDDGKMSFMDGRLSTKLGWIMDMPCARYGQSASNPALNGSMR
ncbi:hypothetical protein P692DRAFT_201793255 [Suillus brevipes Sb2]|nr:hypothetical protein P692DRAFT_201793255 [Suillus brevipes Sb2]